MVEFQLHHGSYRMKTQQVEGDLVGHGGHFTRQLHSLAVDDVLQLVAEGETTLVAGEVQNIFRAEESVLAKLLHILSNAQNLEGWHLEDHRVAGTIQRCSARGTNVAGGRSKGKRSLGNGAKEST